MLKTTWESWDSLGDIENSVFGSNQKDNLPTHQSLIFEDVGKNKYWCNFSITDEENSFVEPLLKGQYVDWGDLVSDWLWHQTHL